VAGARRASAAEPVSVGMVNTISDAGFFVAEAAFGLRSPSTRFYRLYSPNIAAISAKM
jgi:hypothetical protein